MPHHGQDPIDAELARHLQEQMEKSAKNLGLGATGQFPEGKLAHHDEGEIKLAITHHERKVIINFGHPVAFVAFNKEQALKLAQTIIEHAEDI